MIYSKTKMENKPCPTCGAAMFQIRKQKYGSYELQCFSPSCLKPMPIGMIVGDIHGHCEKQYNIRGNPVVCYPDAMKDGYSDVLRAAVSKHLEKIGFFDISFKTPGGNDPEQHTIILGKHISPLVNVGMQSGPQMYHALGFVNRFGVVDLKTSWHERDSKRYWSWDSAASAVAAYCTEHYIKGGCSTEKVFVLPGRENLKIKSEETLINARKRALMSEVSGYQYKIAGYTRDIARNEEYIEGTKKLYLQEFGEEMPEVKVA